MRNKPIHYCLILVLGFAPILSFAQQDSLRKEVKVVKAYQPSISDAFKINDIPKIEDSKTEKPSFNYQISPQPVFTTFSTEPVQAAEMVGEPPQEIGKGLLKAGVGNYQTPYAEFFYNTNAGKNSDFGLHFKHFSSHGKVKLINKDRVEAPYSDNLAELYSKHYFSGSNLHTKLYFERKAHRYYGYTGPQIADDKKEMVISNWQQKQAFSRSGFSLDLFSSESNKAGTDYAIKLNYQNFRTKTGQTEHLIQAETKLSHEFDSFKGLLDASISYLKTDSIFNTTSNRFGHKQQILLSASPAVLLKADNASLKAGLNFFMMLDDDADARLLVTPNIRGEWSPAKNILSVYAGISGYLKHNHYSVIAKENPFVDPFQDIKNSEFQYILFGGINGKFSQKFNYRVQVDYASIKNQHFYLLNHRQVNQSGDPQPIQSLSNTFDVQYDNLKQLTVGTELYYTASELFNFYFEGNFYSYDLKTLGLPWHKPEFDATLSARFRPEGPLSFTADVILIGERKAAEITSLPEVGLSTKHTVMDPVFDLNFGLEYQYSPQLSFFGRANNFAFQKYESWLGYARQGFNLLLGASYSF